MLVLIYFLGKFGLKMDKVMIRCGGEDLETVKDVGGVKIRSSVLANVVFPVTV